MISLEKFKCIFCNEAEAGYYCEECRSSFCLRCAQEKNEEYVFCGSCGSKEIQQEKDKNSKIIQKCLECGSVYVRTGMKKWKLCPNCNSSMVKNILDKRVELNNAFQKNIKDLIYGYELLQDFSRRLKETRKRLVFLRHRGYLHYPQMEETLTLLFQEIVAIKKKIESRAQQVSNAVTAQLVDFSYPDNWSPHNFPQIQTAIDRITADINEYKRYAKDLMAKPENRLEEVVRLVKLLNFHWKHFEENRENIDLEISEKPVAAIPSVKYVGSSFLGLDKCKGILLFTDKRLMFLREKGIRNKSYSKHFEFPLKNFQFGIEGAILKKVFFENLQGDLKFSASKNILEAIGKYFELAKNFGLNSIKDDQQIKKLESQELTLDDLKRELNKKILNIFTPKIKEPIQELTAKPTFPNITYGSTRKPINRLIVNKATPPNIDEIQRKEMFFWKSKKFSTEQLLKKIDELWQRGEIPVEEYFKRIKSLNEELYLIDKKLKELEVQSETII
ncbi:MAG: hypothetical protein ACUVXA_04165 [Candidatus Jordarchaeum sp.]|uniref:hypothetical protein n=1 Tax=Candidatus Jordarchaeum sp. TaxID=2823881 RepID=UPI00404AF46F